MAKPNKKEVTPMKLNKGPRILDETDESPAPEVVETEGEASEEVEETVEEVVEEVKSKPQVSQVVSVNSDMVNFSFLIDIDPAPVVGPFKFIDELGLTTIKSGTTVAIPLHVAKHLKDKKVGVIVA